MEPAEERRIIEALILASPEPVNLGQLASIVPGLTPSAAQERVDELNAEYAQRNRAFEICPVAGGFQVRTRPEFAAYVQQLRKERPLRLSQAALETLAIVAYKQPLTRAELEDVRGVDSGAVLRSLLDRRLLRLLGHRDVPGRPLIYGTGKRFLEVFGLESLKQLPSLRELEELAKEQGVELASIDPLDLDGTDAPPYEGETSGSENAPGETPEEPGTETDGVAADDEPGIEVDAQPASTPRPRPVPGMPAVIGD